MYRHQKGHTRTMVSMKWSDSSVKYHHVPSMGCSWSQVPLHRDLPLCLGAGWSWCSCWNSTMKDRSKTHTHTLHQIQCTVHSPWWVRVSRPHAGSIVNHGMWVKCDRRPTDRTHLSWNLKEPVHYGLFRCCSQFEMEGQDTICCWNGECGLYYCTNSNMLFLK